MQNKWIFVGFSLFIFSMINSCAVPTKQADVSSSQTVPTKTEEVINSTPTIEASPTVTPSPSPSPSPTPFPVPQVISLENASTLKNTLLMGPGTLQSMKVSPDGETVLLGYSGQLVLLRLSDLSTIWQVNPNRTIESVAFSKDGSQLISTTPNGTVQIWDVKSGKELSTPRIQKEHILTASLSEYGDYAAILDVDGITTVWNTGNSKFVQENNGKSFPEGVYNIQVSPDGEILLINGIDSGHNYQVQQWNTLDGSYKLALKRTNFHMSDWRFSTDGKQIFCIEDQQTAAEKSSIINIWNTEKGTIEKKFKNFQEITNYQVSSDGKTLLASTVEKEILIIDLEKVAKTGEFTGHEAKIAAMSFSPDNQTVISIDFSGEIKTWNVNDQEILAKAKSPVIAAYAPVDFSNYGHYVSIISNDQKSIDVVDSTTWKSIHTLKSKTDDQILHSAISPNGTYIAGSDDKNRLMIWDASIGELIKTREKAQRFTIRKMSFSPDGSELATLSIGEVIIWDTKTWEKKRELAGYFGFDYSPSGKLIATDSVDYALYVVDMITGKQIYNLYADIITSIKFAPDGKFIAVGARTIRLRDDPIKNFVFLVDNDNKKKLPIEMLDSFGSVTAIAFSPVSEIMATCDTQGNVRLWNYKNGQSLALYEEISSSPDSLTFNKEGTLLYVGGWDGTVSIISTTAGTGTAIPTTANPFTAMVQ